MAAHQTGYVEKVYKAAQRAARKAAGLCQDCGRPGLLTTQRCEACAARRLAADRARRAERMAAGLLSTTERRRIAGKCPRCGGERDDYNITCSSCRAASKEYRETDGAALMLERRIAGRCIKCNRSAVDGHNLCSEHLEKARDHSVRAQRHLRERRRMAGLCEGCRAPVVPGLRYCAAHHTVKLLAAYAPMPALKVARLVAAKYTGRCAYTDLPIPMGGIGQLEHIYPKRHRPDLIVEPTNLVWVHQCVNDAKADMLPDDPLLSCILQPAIVERIRACAAAVRLV